MKRLVAHALAIAIGACAGIAAAQLNGGVMESQRQGTSAITSGAINGTTIGATTPSSGAFTTLSATGATADRTRSVDSCALRERSERFRCKFRRFANNGSGDRSSGRSARTAATRGTHVHRRRPLNEHTNVDRGHDAGAVSVWGRAAARTTAAAAGNVGELLTTTVASGSAVAHDRDVGEHRDALAHRWRLGLQRAGHAQRRRDDERHAPADRHLATTATLPTQAGGSGIGTDPLAIWRQAAAVPGGALTTNVGPVRVSLSARRTSSSWRTTPSPSRP
jgi:hypothetical protein